MKLLIILSFIGIVLVIYACSTPKVNFASDPDGGIQYKKENWSEVLACAKLENKLIFLDVYASWCGPCKKLKAYTFADHAVGKYFNENFINAAVDGEKGDGPALASTYRIKGYPTLLFIDASGYVVSREMGFHSPEELIILGKSAVIKSLNNK